MNFLSKFKLWPIYPSEFKKFMQTALLMCCILFNYNLLRGIKDSLVVPICGIEILGALDLFVLLFSVFFVFVYVQLTKIMTKTSRYALICLVFCGFFIISSIFLIPYYKILFVDFTYLLTILPRLKWPFLVISYWPISLFYIFSELWGAVMLGLMFWQLANDVTTLQESKRFYGVFGVVANLSTILSGMILQIVSCRIKNYNLLVVCIAMITSISGLISIYLYHRIVNTASIKDKKINIKQQSASTLLIIKTVLTSRYLMYLSILVICYGICVILAEIVWKSQIVLLFNNPLLYGSYVGKYQIYLGSLTIIFLVFGANILKTVKWKTAALIPPLVMLVSGAVFFLSTLFPGITSSLFYSTGFSAVAIAVGIGQVQNVFSRASKYSLFDATKEMVYIPLNTELKTCGKAAVDVIALRIGKTGAASIQLLLLIIFNNYAFHDLLGIVAIIFFIFVFLWIFAVIKLNNLMEANIDFEELKAA